jgi:hypothetical protein
MLIWCSIGDMLIWGICLFGEYAHLGLLTTRLSDTETNVVIFAIEINYYRSKFSKA